MEDEGNIFLPNNCMILK